MGKKNEIDIDSGYFEDGLPYVRLGDKEKILVCIEALSFKHEPLSGFELKQLIGSTKLLQNDYTIYNIGRKPNLPENYLMDKMAEDYAIAIKREFNKPVDLIGTSTGGQIIHYIAGNHPEIVRKAVIISSAYKLSETGKEIERKSAEYFKKGKYGACLATLMKGMMSSKIAIALMIPMIKLFGKKIMGNIEYPNDFLTEVVADREMNFKDRLKDIKCPTLIISGAKDKFYDIQDVKDTAQGIPNAQLKIFEKYGHDLTMWKNKEVYSVVREFLADKS